MTESKGDRPGNFVHFEKGYYEPRIVLGWDSPHDVGMNVFLDFVIVAHIDHSPPYGVSDVETSRCCIQCDMETSSMHWKYRFGGLMVTNLPDGAKITQQIPGETGTMIELMMAMEVIA